MLMSVINTCPELARNSVATSTERGARVARHLLCTTLYATVICFHAPISRAPSQVARHTANTRPK